MQRTTLEPIACQFMNMALSNHVHDGYVAFVVLLLNKQNEITAMAVAAPDADARSALGDMLRMLAPHLNVIFII